LRGDDYKSCTHEVGKGKGRGSASKMEGRSETSESLFGYTNDEGALDLIIKETNEVPKVAHKTRIVQSEGNLLVSKSAENREKRKSDIEYLREAVGGLSDIRE